MNHVAYQILHDYHHQTLDDHDPNTSPFHFELIHIPPPMAFQQIEVVADEDIDYQVE
jgi:hypothetical protein